MDEYCEFRNFLVAKGCPGSTRDITKVLVWLKHEDVTCPEDLQHLRKLSNFKGVDNYSCSIIAFIDSLIGVCCSTSLQTFGRMRFVAVRMKVRSRTLCTKWLMTQLWK